MPAVRHKFLKAVEVTLLSLVVFVAVLVIALYAVANSGLPGHLLSEHDRHFMDADVEFSDISLHGLGDMTLIVDSLRVTYLHGTFPEPLPCESGGSGAESDTLLSVDRISMRFKPLRMLFFRRIAVPEADIEGLKAYLRRYCDTLTNLSVFGLSSPKDPAAGTNLRFSVKNLNIDGNPVLEYSDRTKGLSARLTMTGLGAGGMMKLSPEGIGLRKSHVAIDSLCLDAASGGDRYRFDLPCLWLDEPRPGLFDLNFRSEVSANTSMYGRLDIPLDIDAGFRAAPDGSGYSFDISDLEAYVAHIPLSASGIVMTGSESPYLRMNVSAPSCPLDTLMQEYSALVPGLKDMLGICGRLSLDLSLDGSFAHDSIPEMALSLELPRGGIVYRPQKLSGNLALDLDAVISPSKTMEAHLHKFTCNGRGFSITIGAQASGLFGGDPDVRLEAGLSAELEKLASVMHFKSPVDAHGNLAMDLEWNARLSEIRSMHLDKTSIVGHVSSDSLIVGADSLEVRAYNTMAGLSSGGDGLSMSVGADSLFLDAGDAFSARLRNTRNSVSLTMAPRRSGTLTPRLAVKSHSGRAFFKAGPHRFFGNSLEVEASAHKKNIANLLKRNLFLDSLQRIYPDVPRQNLIMVARDSLYGSGPVPAFLADKSLAKGDIDISLDTSKSGILNKWSLAGNVCMLRGGFASTMMPLRTRFSGLDVHFDGRNLSIDTLGIVCGSSDLGIKGRLDGLGRALVSKSKMDLYADIRSRHLNVNEIVSAFKVGGENVWKARRDVEDVSFVTDTLQDAVPELPPLSLVIVPANIHARVNALLDSVDFTYFRINPLRAKAVMKDRTVQFIDSGFMSDYGDLALDAFYSTISRKDISAGANLSISSINAQQIISVLPSVDTLMPALKTFMGNFSCDLSATAKLDTNMNVIPSTLDGLLRIRGSRLHIADAGGLKKLTTTLMFKNKDIGDISDFSASAVAHDGKLEVFPFEFSADRYRVALWGVQGLDRSLYYHVSLLKSPLIFNFGINIYGTLDRWRWNLTSARFGDGNIPTFSTELDAMQLNIHDYVRNIFDRGVSNISRFNEEPMKAIKMKGDTLDISSGEDFSKLSPGELGKIDAALVAYQLEQENEELDKEIESVLDDSFRETSLMIDAYVSDFEKIAYDNKTRRKIERLKSGKK